MLIVCVDDHSRVKLEMIEGEPCSDYINANYLDVRLCIEHIQFHSVNLYLQGYNSKNSFIAAQGMNLLMEP